ncbi:hypothetical protein M116_2195 [Bacteroides fragilis str. 3719 A10]|nr:hypothetical protein M085_4434 [Bacteroides fragilis str. 3986 N(B)19]EXZ57944.1 hypothetical protein M116_2195 [Bacteroides fragilis str. 3719 A10]EXZ78668.1 hypothetical protein M144_2083 [Bacteroides fragilis str. 3-F-2 \
MLIHVIRGEFKTTPEKTFCPKPVFELSFIHYYCLILPY